MLTTAGVHNALPCSSESPEYGTLPWIISASLRLCAPRVLHNPEHKKLVLSAMIGLLVGNHIRGLEPCLFLDMLKVG